MTWTDGIGTNTLGEVSTVAEGPAFPSSLAFDNEGNAYIGETGLPFC